MSQGICTKLKLEPKSGNGNTAHSFGSIVSLLRPHSIPSPGPVLQANTAASVPQQGCGQTAMHSSKAAVDPRTADFFRLTSPWYVLHENKWGSNWRARMKAETS